MAYRVTSAWMLCLLTTLAGCGDDGDAAEASAGDTEAVTGSTEDDGSTQGSTDGATDTGSSGAPEDDSSSGSSDSGGEPEHADLFACEGIAPSCETILQHIDPEPPEALECAGQLVTSGQPGVISALDAPGPDIDETDSLILVLGDGTALVQTRHRECSEFGDPPCLDSENLPWEPPSEHRLCTIEIDAELQAACDPACETDCNCAWDPFFSPLVDCQPVDDWSCDDALAALAAR